MRRLECAILILLVLAALAWPQALDYTLYADVLETHVDDQGMVNYSGLQNNRADLDSFVKALGLLEQKQIDAWAENDRIAFYVNAYNAFTLRVIIDNYPIKKGGFFRARFYPANSIRQIAGVWDDIEFSLAGSEVTLEYIEHKILRKKYNQPGIHMALVCAAMGCPPLRNEPFSGTDLEKQLKEQGTQFMANTLKFKIDRAEKRVYISPIFDWFEGDFYATYKTDDYFKKQGKKMRAVLNFISNHISDADKTWLQTAKYKVKYLEYDWTLNEQE